MRQQPLNRLLCCLLRPLFDAVPGQSVRGNLSFRQQLFPTWSRGHTSVRFVILVGHDSDENAAALALFGPFKLEGFG